MMDLLWGLLLFLGAALGVIRGRPEAMTAEVFRAAEGAITLVLGLLGTLALWGGLMRIIQEAGLPRAMARLFHPILTRLFPGIPRDHPALGSIAMALGANLLGLGNASTPLGLKAMKELHLLSRDPTTPSPEECTFLCLVMGGLTLIPATVIALRARYRSQEPAACLGPAFLATLIGTIAALTVDGLARRKKKGKREK
ncbi:MAG: nucleoside recognition domain-containing protein [Bacillota bacterium]